MTTKHLAGTEVSKQETGDLFARMRNTCVGKFAPGIVNQPRYKAHKIVNIELVKLENTVNHSSRLIKNLKIISERDSIIPIQLVREPTGYKIIDGNHRIAACKILGYQAIPAYVTDETIENDSDYIESDGDDETYCVDDE